MIVAMRRWPILLCLCAAPSACGDPVATPGVVVERQQLALTVLDDGSVQVREDLTVRFPETPVTEFWRRVPLERADAIFDAEAALDGRRFLPNGPPVATLTIDPDLRARWVFPPAASVSHVFTLTFRASAAVARQGPRGMLRWRAQPLIPAYPVETTELALTLPSRAEWLAPPLPAGLPWTVVTRPDGFTATRAAGPPDEPVAIAADFSVDRLGIAEPTWQFREARARELAPAWASSGIFVLLIAVGIVWMVRVQYRAPRGAATESEATGTTGDRAPTYAPAIQTALSARGHVPRELRMELIAAGLVSAERAGVADGLRTSGLVVMVFGLICAAAVPLLLPGFGMWPYALPGGLVLSGAMLVPLGARLSLLTDAGERARATVAEARCATLSNVSDSQ
jgi:hypothetical protein